MHLFTELLHIASEPVCLGTLLFTLVSPLYQIRALSTAYHIIPPTKASGAHGASLRAAETRKRFWACLPAVHPNTLLHRVGVVWVSLGLYDDRNHIWDTSSNILRMPVTKVTVCTEDKGGICFHLSPFVCLLIFFLVPYKGNNRTIK